MERHDPSCWAGDAPSLVGGVDITPLPPAAGGRQAGPKRAIAGLVALGFPDLRPVYSEFLTVDLPMPYVPGFLGLRCVGRRRPQRPAAHGA